MYPVLILFGTNVVSYNIASALQDANYSTIAFMPLERIRLYRYSKVYNKVGISNHHFSSDAYLNELLKFLENYNYKGKILTFLTNDNSVVFWIKNFNRLKKYCTIQVDDLIPFYNKLKLLHSLDEISISCPKTLPILNNKTVQFYPFLAKPAYKDLHNKFLKKFKSKVKIINKEEDLKDLEEFNSDEIIYQEIIDFDIGDEYDWWGYRNKDGEIYSVVSNLKEKFPDKNGRVARCKIVQNEAVKKAGDLIVEKLNYTGIGDIQFIYDKKSMVYKVIEMNPRMWCSHELLLMNNVDFIRLCVDDFYNIIKSENKSNYLNGLDITHNKEWYSCFFDIKNNNLINLKCTEFYKCKNDNLLTKINIRFFLIAKFLYYFMFRKTL